MPIDPSLLPPPAERFVFLKGLAWTEEVLGAISISFGIVFAIAAVDKGEWGPAIGALASGIALVTTGELLRVILQIEVNTRK